MSRTTSLVEPDPDAALNVLRTTFETDRIPESWLPVLETFDEIWVFSEFNRNSFRRAGVAPEKLRVLGSYVDTEQFSPQGKKWKLPETLQGRFVFLSFFDWQLRKGWDVLLRAYCQEFSALSKTGLLLKVTTTHMRSSQEIQEQFAKLLGKLGISKRSDIVLINQTLGPAEMAALYRAADAFVMPSRGEGWGRTYMEAMACGLPTIGTRGSGNMDFMNEENSFLVAATEERVPSEAVAEIPVYEGHRWLEPDLGELRRAMRKVLENGTFRTRIAKRAVAFIREKFDRRKARDAVEINLRQAEERFLTPEVPLPEPSQIRVQLEGELHAEHSFSNINEKLVLHLSADERLCLNIHRVRYNPTSDRTAVDGAKIRPYISRALPGQPQVVIRHAFPPNWEPPSHAKWVHIQPWEFGALPLDWVEPLRDVVDEIWAPSFFVKRVYERSGIAADKIHVIPWGVSADIYHPLVLARILSTDKSFRFLFVGGTIARKGIDLLLEAYTQEFQTHEDVCLVIKDMGTRTFYRYGNYREQILRAVNDSSVPQILYFDQSMTEGQLASLYTACNCLVAPYRGEGFGLPILEAMACGLCPIVPGTGASIDFTSGETALLLDADVVESAHEWRLCGVPTELSIGVPTLRHALRHAFEQRSQTRERGRRASEFARSNFTWQRTARLMADRIVALTSGDGKKHNCVKAARCPTISLCVLIRNDEGLIGDCLGRLRPFVDEIIAIDIGSTDRSKQIALEYGTRVYQDEWRDNYALARNLAIVRATSDWVLFLDPWDQIDDPPASSIKDIVKSKASNIVGINIRVKSDTSVGMETRLFRNQNGIVYERRGFEQVRDGIHRRHGLIVDSEIEIRCTKRKSLEEVQERRRLLYLDKQERPGDPLISLALALNHFYDGNYFHAECYLTEFLKTPTKIREDQFLAAKLLVESHRLKGDIHRALEAADAALTGFPGNEHFQIQQAELRSLIGASA